MGGGTAPSRWGTVQGVFGDRDLARLLIAVGSWAATDWGFLLAASVLAFDLGGPAAVGLVGAVRVLPAAACAGVVTILADRFPRPLIVASVNGAFVVVALAAAAVARTGAALGVLLVVLGAGSAVSALLKPSLQALLPQLVRHPSQLMPATAAWSTVNGVGTVVGPAVAGLLLAARGPGAVFVALASVYAVTAALSATIRSPSVRPGRPVARAIGRSCSPRCGAFGSSPPPVRGRSSPSSWSNGPCTG